MYSLLLCIVKISLFGVMTAISLNTEERREKAYVCGNYPMKHLKGNGFLVLDACSYKNLSDPNVP